MKLTIGMIVKNEEKYLERCLNSIKPILDNVDSELIITDTGSTDRTLEIAAGFTDRIQHFEWVNDFSAARNTTVELAKGEWYMFVDGDDIFESCDDIIHFFNSGEYKKYHCASFKYRNIINLGKGTFIDQNVIRMTERYPETEFIGRIHENLSPLNTPVKMISDIVDHYGYLYDEENPETDKMQRNEELLLKELEEIPKTDRKHSFIYYYLFESLRNIEPEKAEKYLDMGIKDASETGSDALVPMYMDKIGVFFKRVDYSSLIELCDDYFALNNGSEKHPTADAEMYAAKALSLSNLERQTEAFEVYRTFFRTFNKIKDNNVPDIDRFTASPVLASDANYLNVVMKFIICGVTEGKINEVNEFLCNADLAPYSHNNKTVAYIVENEIALLSKCGYENAHKFYNNLSEYGRTVFRNSLCNVIFVDANKNAVIEALEAISGSDEELKEKIDIYKSYFVNKEINESTISEFAHKYGTERNYDILFIMMKCGMDISSLFDIADFDPVVCIKRCCDYLYGFYDVAADYGAEYVRSNDAFPAVVKLYEYCMKCAVEVNRGVDDLVEVYSSLGNKYASSLEIDQLSPEISSARLFYVAKSARKEKKYNECFAKIKEAIEIYPNITPVAAKYQENVSSEFEEEASQKSLSPEMRKLSEMLKTNVRNMIINGNINSAKKYLDEYEKINPDDTEIPILRNMIG